MSFNTRPGAARVGLCAKPKSTPAFKPEAFSKVSFTSVSVIPGPVVLATTTIEPARNPRPTSLQGRSMVEYSGFFFLSIGVGTTNRMMSLTEAVSLMFVVARKLPFFTCFSIRSRSPVSEKGALLLFKRSTVRTLTSTPITLNPASAKRHAVGNPILPHPMTPTVNFRRFSGASNVTSSIIIAVGISSPFIEFC